MSTPVDSTAKTAWWMLLIRAVLTLAFGVVALASPGIALLVLDLGVAALAPPGAALVVLVYSFGTYAAREALAAISFGTPPRRSEPHWGWSVAQGVISVLAGLTALVWPGPTAVTLLFLIAV